VHTSRLTRISAVALAVAALGAPAASAGPAPEPGGNKPASRPVSREIHKGVDWGSAALGAGGAASVLLLTGAGATALVRRRHRVGVVT
jgi:hypothetical protein